MLDFLESLLRGAGDILLKYHGKLGAHQIGFKSGRDLITAADTESELYVVGRIKEKFPSDNIYAEEQGAKPGSGGRWWFIDPLDGTTNFAHGLPLFCCSIGVWDNGALRYGGVIGPYVRELFLGERDKGAWLNGMSVKVSEVKDLKHALVSTGFSYNRNEIKNNNLETFSYFALRCQCIRRLGAAALDLCYVACGRLEAYWEAYLGPYDSAGGAVVLREAGGKLTDYAGGQDWLFGENLLASNGHLHPLMQPHLAPLEPPAGKRFFRPPGVVVAPDNWKTP